MTKILVTEKINFLKPTLPKDHSKLVFDEIVSFLKSSIIQGCDIEIRRFGSFKLKKRFVGKNETIWGKNQKDLAPKLFKNIQFTPSDKLTKII